jgi:GT2 family glycosyltransferase
METFPHIAIAILNYNGRHFFDEFLPSVLQQQYPDFSVWVIDNASTDDSVAYLQQHYPQVKLISNPWNGGFAAGYNMGLSKIVANYWLLLNSDVKVTPHFLMPLVQSMLGYPNTAFVQPKILQYPEGELFEYAGAAGGYIDRLGYPFCRGRLFDTLEKDDGQYNDETEVFWGSGAALLVKREAFEKTGGFYGYFFMHNEEIDLCWRARNLGWKVVFNGQSTVSHLGGGSLKKDNPRKTYFNFRNNLVMNARNQPLLALICILPLRFLLDTAASVQMLLQGQTNNAIGVMKAWIHFLGWLVVPAESKWPKHRGWGNKSGVFHGSIVWQYFVRKKQRFPFS